MAKALGTTREDEHKTDLYKVSAVGISFFDAREGAALADSIFSSLAPHRPDRSLLHRHLPEGDD